MLAGLAQHPAVALDAIGDVAEPVDEVVLKAEIGEEFRNADVLQRRIAGTFEHAGGIRAAFLRSHPVAGAGRAGLRFQQRIGALRHVQAGKGLLALPDQAAIELDERLPAFEVEHGVELLFERLAAFGVGGARIEIVGPVAPHPGLDQLAILRLLPAEHQIDLQCLVDEARIGGLGVELLFQAEDQARAEHPLERDVIVRSRRLTAADRAG